MIYKNLPKKFNSEFECVSCHIEYQDKILLLRRCRNKVEGGKWGLPAGKIEKDEDKVKALRREIKEETGINLRVKQLKYLTKVYVKHPVFHYIFYIYKVVLKKQPMIKLKTDENRAYKWVLPKSALKMKLIRGQDKCFKIVYKLNK